MKQLLKKQIPVTWQKKWYRLKHPGVLDEVEIAYYLLKKGDPHKVMFDVGAHVGGALDLFAVKGWEVFAFEPDPNNRKKLIADWQAYPGVHIEPIALSDQEEGELSFYTSDVSSGISSLLKFHETHQEVEKVPVTNLKKYCRDHGVEHISFLKIDTEGYDLPVLRGVDWHKTKPRVIVTEFDNHKTIHLGYKMQEQAALLQDQGYRVLVSEWHPIVEYGQTHKWRRFVTDPAKVTGERVWGNLICVLEEDWDELLRVAGKFGKIDTP